MPLGDALGLIERDFNNYLYGPSRDSLPPPSAASGASPARSSVTSLMTRAASGEQLNESELSMLISSLQQQQTKPTTSRPLAALGNTNTLLLHIHCFHLIVLLLQVLVVAVLLMQLKAACSDSRLICKLRY